MPELPPPAAVTSTVLSTADHVSRQLKDHEADLARNIDQGLQALRYHAKEGAGVDLPPLPEGKEVARDLVRDVGRANEELQNAEKNGGQVSKTIERGERDLVEAARAVGLAQTKRQAGADTIERNTPTPQDVEGFLRANMQAAKEVAGDKNLGRNIQHGLDEFKREIKRAGGDVTERFPSGEQLAKFVARVVADAGRDAERGIPEIAREYSGARQGLIAAARDMKLAQTSKGPSEAEIAKEVEEGADELIREARAKGYHVRIPENAAEARADFEADLEALDGELRNGDFDDEIEELEEIAREEGQDLGDLKEEAEHFIEEEEGQLKH
jgi:hypothetical protein